MKKLFFVLFMAIVSLNANAQAGAIELGGKLNYGFDTEAVGFGIVGRYNFTNNFRGEALFNYYPKKDHVSYWDTDLNLHYVFHVTDRFKLYPLGGIALVGWSEDVFDTSDSKIGANLGGGLQFNITGNLHLNAEAFWQYVEDHDQAVTNISLVYVF